MIYFVQAVDGGPIKIGFSDDVDRRVKELEGHYDRPLAVLATIDGDIQTEAHLHARFGHLRFGRTEQFRPDAELLEFIGRPLFASAADVVPMRSESAPPIIAIRCTPSYRKRVEQAAKKEFRDSSGLIALALQEYFEKRGYEPLPARLGDAE